MTPTVGAGKTMLMDLFYQSLEISHKQRVHFNAFMLDVHESTQVYVRTYVRMYVCAFMYMYIVYVQYSSGPKNAHMYVCIRDEGG